MSLFTNIELRNVSGHELEIPDLQKTIPIDGTATLVGTLPEDVGNSLDLIKALVDDKIQLFDTIQNYYISQTASIQLVASGGGGTFVNWDGVPRVHSSPRPLDALTYFTACGDDVTNPDPSKVKGFGNRMLYNLKSTDVSQEVDIVFDEDIQVKDGFMIVANAPFGANMDVDVIIPKGHPAGHPLIDLFVARFANKVPLLENGWFPMDSADGGRLYQGWILRVRVNNAAGNEFLGNGNPNPDYDPRQDPPATFKVAGRLEIFRNVTVQLPG